eukprot:8136650-Pyramimonas_sp.AAC.1
MCTAAKAALTAPGRESKKGERKQSPSPRCVLLALDVPACFSSHALNGVLDQMEHRRTRAAIARLAMANGRADPNTATVPEQ